MTRTKFKKIPFDIELAKKITNKEVKGRIVTKEGKKVRIICWDKKPVDEEAHEYPIVALIQNDYNGEMSQTFTAEGAACYPNYKSRYDLIIEIPTYYLDYSNFMPQKWQTCIVRNFNYEVWVIRVCCGKDSDGGPTFFNTPSYHYWNYILPLNNVTERLVGTTENYEQLIQELDAASTATAKKRTTMTRTTYKRVPFNLELAKKIKNKEVKGRIVTEDGLTARIVCFDYNFGGKKDNIVVIIEHTGYEGVLTCFADGLYHSDFFNKKCALHLEVPTYYRDYSNFVPQRWQNCLVRDYSLDIWRVAVCSGKDAYGIPIFYSENYSDGSCHWVHFLPISKVTERLVNTKKSYEELIKELDENGKD